MTRQRNKFANFLISFAPGCGQMFMGFLKRGISFTFYFCCCIALIVATNMTIFIVPMILVYIYAFFDSMQLNWLPVEQFQEQNDGYFVPDKFGKRVDNRKIAKIIGIALIFVGLIIFANTVGSALYRTFSEYLSESIVNFIYNAIRLFPSLVICVVTIIVGIRLIVGRKKELLEEEMTAEEGAQHAG